MTAYLKIRSSGICNPGISGVCSTSPFVRLSVTGAAKRSRSASRRHTRMLSRQPSAEELAMCERFLAGQTTRLADPDRLTAFAGGPKADIAPASDPRMRARENLIHVLLNHNDFVTIR